MLAQRGDSRRWIKAETWIGRGGVHLPGVRVEVSSDNSVGVPSRKVVPPILTVVPGVGSGQRAAEVTVPGVSDKRTAPATVSGSGSVGAIPLPWARKTPKIAEVLLLLYLHGLCCKHGFLS